MRKYETIRKSFAKFFESEVLQKTLDSKVDELKFDKVVETKVSHEELSTLLQVQNLHDRKMKHMAMILVEIAKSLIPEPNDDGSLQGKVHRHELLHR